MKTNEPNLTYRDSQALDILGGNWKTVAELRKSNGLVNHNNFKNLVNAGYAEMGFTDEFGLHEKRFYVFRRSG